ncbi:hypothetical protein GCM10029978_064840 [Actinoallomurus acanthiterrae]
MVVVVVAIAVLFGVAAGCGSGVDPVAEADHAASIATTHGGSSGIEIVLPINAYEYTVPERDQIGWARDILIGECMRGFDFSYDAAADAAQNRRLARMDMQDLGFYGNKRRYSVIDMATAASYGYHLISTTTGAPSTVDQTNPHGLGRLSATKTVVMTGYGPDGKPVSRSATGRRIPAGGCVGVADAKLVGSGSVGEAKPVSELAARSFDQSLKNVKVTAAFRAWSSCMAGRGDHYTSPLDKTGFNIDIKTVSPQETATAQADVACKQQTHLVDTWFNVELAYQKNWIEKHADEFHKAKTDHDRTMITVSRIISSNP